MNKRTTALIFVALSACQMATTDGARDSNTAVFEPWGGALPVGIDRGLPDNFPEEEVFFNSTNKCFYYVVDGKMQRVPDDPETGNAACIAK